MMWFNLKGLLRGKGRGGGGCVPVPREVYADDVFLVSYPRSGNTWVRFLIGNYLSGNGCDFERVPGLVPDIHEGRAGCEGLSRPRVIKSHAGYREEYPKVIYLARDVRDVAVSYYYYCLKYRRIDGETSFARFVEMFNGGELDGFGSWSEHVGGWLDGGPRGMLVMRYEQIKAEPVWALSMMLRYAGYEVEAGRVEAAVEASRFERMQALEREQHATFGGLARGDRRIPFVRSGQVGGRDPLLSEELRSALMERHGAAMRRLGYTVEGEETEMGARAA